ncbi:MAG TPA: nucleoside-triphosphatase [Bacteroidales bacterium]|nr:nucleoside-triphosphatase [Bacteroidales bacterium]
MTNSKRLSNKWLKASVLGCLWASSEIVIGSFLHNLKVPFAGNVLTAIGIILLISVAHIWKEKGLFWRSGVVCALMKSISPSAVIFGPMIAIFFEALLMELSVRIFRKNIFSFLLAGGLAMLWNLFFVVANYIIIYGFNIVELYSNLAVFAQKQLHISADVYWMPIVVLGVVYFIFGMLCALYAIVIGRKAARQPLQHQSLTVNQVQKIKSGKTDTIFSFSFLWLAINIIMLVIVLALISFVPWPYWTAAGSALLALWIARYRQTLRLLSRPKFWISFVIITMLSAFLLYQLKNSDSSLLKGLFIGLEMNFRAALVIIGFSVIGTELRNPDFKKLFVHSRIWQLPLALEIAFDTLPLMVSNLPKTRELFKKPSLTFRQLVARADFWLEKTELKLNDRQNVIIVSGSERTGKSTFLTHIIHQLKDKNLRPGGFVAPALYENDVNIGHDLVDLSNDQRVVLSRFQGDAAMPAVGKFFFSQDGIETGKKILSLENLTGTDVVVVDEVGPWELQNQGWGHHLTQLVKSYNNPMIWVVRQSIVDKVIENWSLKNPLIVEANNENINTVTNAIILYSTKKSVG